MCIELVMQCHGLSRPSAMFHVFLKFDGDFLELLNYLIRIRDRREGT